MAVKGLKRNGKKNFFAQNSSNCVCNHSGADWNQKNEILKISSALLNPLTAKDEYLRSWLGRTCRRYSAFHRQNHAKRPELFERGQNLLQNGILNFAISLSQSPAIAFKVRIYTGRKATFCKRAWQLRG